VGWLAASALLAGVLNFIVQPNPVGLVASFQPPVESNPVKSTDSTNVSFNISFFDFKVDESPPFAIFYNIFVPSDQGEKGVANSLRIVQEQLRQVGSSYAASLDRHPTLFYNTIGKRDGIEANTMQILCHDNNLTCTHMEHYDDGFEQVTLQKIQDFCFIHEDHRVVYLHTKGAYHQFPHTEIWRRHMTAAATSQDCLAPPDDTCSLCGWVYYPIWTSFMPGNIWTAQCSYIQQLLPPKEFQRKLRNLLKEVLMMRLLGTLSSRMFSGEDLLHGLNRFADEHWVGSHPAVVPCDVAGSVDLKLLWGPEQGPKQTSSKFAMAPQEAVDAKWIYSQPENTQAILANERDRIKEYYFLGGRLFLWLGLYNQVPPESSWVWNWFPDGALWKNTIVGSDQTMERLIQVLETASFLPRNDTASFEPPFVQTATSLGLSIQSNPFQSTDSTNVSFHAYKVHESPPFAIFYNIFVPSDQGEKGVTNSLRIVQEQLRQVGSSYAASLQRQPTLFYNTIGKRDGIEANTMQILCHDNNLTCTHMEHYDDGFEQVTLQKVHDFCSIHEDHRVVYLHTKGAYNKFVHNEVWRRHMTAAATSQDCLAPPDDTCNLCGWVYYPFWASFMPGNIWTAQCSYIQQLLPPKEFQRKLKNLVKEVLIMQLLGTFSSRMFPSGEDYHGLHRYADEHWVGSHPAVVPCDVAGSVELTLLWGSEHTSSNFAMAPQAAVDGKWINGPSKNTQAILKNERDRIKEYYFLGGRLFLWLGLYNQVPPESSWVWNWFPDGARWKNTIAGSDQTMERLIQVLETASFHDG
jgi:hypothetical protein